MFVECVSSLSVRPFGIKPVHCVFVFLFLIFFLCFITYLCIFCCQVLNFLVCLPYFLLFDHMIKSVMSCDILYQMSLSHDLQIFGTHDRVKSGHVILYFNVSYVFSADHVIIFFLDCVDG